MSHLRKLGQFGHTIKRSCHVVKSVQELNHPPGPGPQKLWKSVFLFVALPLVMLCSVNCYLKKEEEESHRPEPIDYPHLKIMNKAFPWRDGKRSLFHNPHRNYLPGVGYEE
ncbi:cytochrome c oxidase subunit 6A1, mitochondrial-like [Osmia bicornis bicornis]|uniref:cytochrome c oxidase subunit 6A1, mitochondrial-like n=1 Tax=Osmia bicornis bicornis TaxID=1437191 RepID=UPI001EAF36F6|nr:cytochrome c oxidase subunit 6A1, mitochondrial-like [Osmia bicornis bicornis]